MPTSIYILVNLVNGKSYVGVTADVEKRLYQHAYGRTDRHQPAISGSIKKYGWDVFAVAILERCESYDHAVKVLEPAHIKRFRTNEREHGYNLTAGGEGSLGLRHTASAKARMSRWHTGKKLSDEHRRRVAAANRLRTHSPETREKQRQAARTRWANVSAQDRRRHMDPAIIASHS